MHSIKDIRNNFEDFKKKIKSRNVDFNLDEIIDLDQQNRDLIHKKERSLDNLIKLIELNIK